MAAVRVIRSSRRAVNAVSVAVSVSAAEVNPRDRRPHVRRTRSFDADPVVRPRARSRRSGRKSQRNDSTATGVRPACRERAPKGPDRSPPGRADRRRVMRTKITVGTRTPGPANPPDRGPTARESVEFSVRPPCGLVPARHASVRRRLRPLTYSNACRRQSRTRRGTFHGCVAATGARLVPGSDLLNTVRGRCTTSSRNVCIAVFAFDPPSRAFAFPFRSRSNPGPDERRLWCAVLRCAHVSPARRLLNRVAARASVGRVTRPPRSLRFRTYVAYVFRNIFFYFARKINVNYHDTPEKFGNTCSSDISHF